MFDDDLEGDGATAIEITLVKDEPSVATKNERYGSQIYWDMQDASPAGEESRAWSRTKAGRRRKNGVYP
jgi:hypothetical protein